MKRVGVLAPPLVDEECFVTLLLRLRLLPVLLRHVRLIKQLANILQCQQHVSSHR